jgi:hypothetical protein
MYKIILIYVTIVKGISGHLVLNRPEVWGLSTELENPLDINTVNPMCGGRTPSENGIVTLQAGNVYNMETICGERDLNGQGCLVGDWHSGGNADDYSGCALGVTYNDYNDMGSYKYISYTKDCPKRGINTQFEISKNVKNCDKCVCSWSWAPSRKYSSPGQFYHNCFYCKIVGGNNGSENNMRNLDFINIKNAQYTDRTYNDINPINIYDEQPTSTQTEQTQTEPTQTEPTQTEQTQTEQTQTEQTQTEQTQTEQTQTEQTQTEQTQTQTEQTQTEPTQTEPTQTEPTQTEQTEQTEQTQTEQTEPTSTQIEQTITEMPKSTLICKKKTVTITVTVIDN